MTLYHYNALGKDGVLHKGVLEASSVAALKKHLREADLSLIRYSRKISLFPSRKIKPRVLLELCLHLEQFEKAGIPLKESLEVLFQAQQLPKLKAILGEIIRDLQGGVLFSKALAKHASVFDPVFIGLISVGEKTGRLAFVFHQLFQHLKWIDEVQAQTLKALRYPMVMVVVLLVVIFILVNTFVPELVGFIEKFSGNLPLSSRTLLAVANFLSAHFLFLLLSGGILFLSMKAVFKFHPQGPLWKDTVVEAIPFIGSLKRKMDLARFCHVFAILFESGIDIFQALPIARKSLRYGLMAMALQRAETFVREGLSLSESFQRVGLFSPFIIRMVKVGEETSSLQKTLLHVKDHFDTSLKRQVDHLVGLIEPLMILILGLVMAGIIYAVFLPLYDLLSTFES